MRNNGEIVEAAYYFTELYDVHISGAPLLEVFLRAAERFTDFNAIEVQAVMAIAERIFETRAAGVSSALVH
jgi:hypothetical protein